MVQPNVTIITVITLFFILLITNILIKTRNPLIKTIFSSTSSILTLILINISASLTGFSIPMNIFSLGASILIGIPGIGLISVLNALIK